MNRNVFKRVNATVRAAVVAGLSLAMVMGGTPAVVWAEGVGATQSEASASAAYTKNQVVYVKTDATGKQTGVYVVNSFDAAKGEKIEDAGTYTKVTNLSTKDKLKDQDGTVTVKGQGDEDFLYQGDLAKNTELPWTVGVSYQLDGKDVSAKELAGATGKLTMKLSIKPNASYAGKGDYADNYLLQVTGSLANEHVRNIQADGATPAQNGANTQLSYMVLPGKDADYTVTADVEDFSFDGWQIAGVPLSLALDVDAGDMDTSQLTELSDGIASANDGAQQVASGAGSLAEAMGSAASGADQLVAGADAAAAGVNKLADGSSQVASGAGQVASGAGTLAAGTASLQAQLPALTVGASSLAQGATNVRQGVESVNSGLGSLQQAFTDPQAGLSAGAQQLATGAQALSDGTAALSGQSAELVSGATGVKNGVDQLAGQLGGLSASLSDGKAQLTQLAGTLTALKTQLQQADPNADTSQIDAALGQIQTLGASLNATVDTSRLQELQKGASDLEAGVKTYTGVVDSQLVPGAQQAATGAGALNAGIGQVESGVAALKDAVGGAGTEAQPTLLQGAMQLEAGANALAGKTPDLVKGADKLNAGAQALASGSSSVADGAGKVNTGLAQLNSQTPALTSGAASLANGLAQLNDGAATLADGSGKLADGTQQLADATVDLDIKLIDTVKDKIQDMLNPDYTPTDFVNNQQGEHVGRVQFVYLTEAISK